MNRIDQHKAEPFMRKQNCRISNNAAGFSLIELVIAMTITMVVMGIASTLIGASFKIRTREQSQSDAIADVERSINIMSREIAVGGFGFDNATNGLVAGDCTTSTLRVRSNLNRYTTETNKYTIADPGEDLKFLLDISPDTNYLVRYDRFAVAPADPRTGLANRVASISFSSLDTSNNVLDVTADPSQVANAAMVRITVGVVLPAVGMAGSAG